jgi:hypothetical protein
MIAKHDLFPEREFIVIPYKQGCYSEHVVWCTRNRITLDPKQPLGLIGDSLSTNYWHQNFVNTGDSEYFPPGTVLTLKEFKEENYPEIKSKKLVVLFTVDGKEYKIFWDLFRRNTRIK